MGKYFFIIILSLFINGCTLANNFNDKVELITNNQKKSTFDSCTNFSYISNINDKNFGVLFSEYINLDSSCSWNGLQRGYFEDLFKTTLKFKSFKILERKDFNNYEFTTYLIDDKYYMNLIYKYSIYEDLFIIDYEGKYFAKMINEFDKNYENKYLNKERFSSNYSNSLVKMNFTNTYFSMNRETFEK